MATSFAHFRVDQALSKAFDAFGQLSRLGSKDRAADLLPGTEPTAAVALKQVHVALLEIDLALLRDTQGAWPVSSIERLDDVNLQPFSQEGEAEPRPQDLSLLLRRIVRHDRSALRLLYETTSRKLFGVCLRILKQREDAEDVLQDVYISVWETAGLFNPKIDRPIAWLASIAREHSIERLQQSSLRGRSPAPRNSDRVPEQARQVVPESKNFSQDVESGAAPGEKSTAPFESEISFGLAEQSLLRTVLMAEEMVVEGKAWHSEFARRSAAIDEMQIATRARLESLVRGTE